MNDAKSVVWTRRALNDLIRIRGHVALERPMAAARLYERLLASGESLGAHPERGRSVGGDVRELVTVAPYAIRYRAAAKTVRILHIRHMARRPN